MRRESEADYLERNGLAPKPDPNAHVALYLDQWLDKLFGYVDTYLPAVAIRQHYEAWCVANNRTPCTPTQMGSYLKIHGCSRAIRTFKEGSVRCWFRGTPECLDDYCKFIMDDEGNSPVDAIFQDVKFMFSSDLRNHYLEWCAQTGESPISARALGGQLTSMGYISALRRVGEQVGRGWISSVGEES